MFKYLVLSSLNKNLWSKHLRLDILAACICLLISGAAISVIAIPRSLKQHFLYTNVQTKLNFEMARVSRPSKSLDAVWFYKRLPTFKGLIVAVHDIRALSASNGVTILDVEYQPVRSGIKPKFGRVEIIAHEKASYLSIKTTIAQLLAAHVDLSLDSITIRRVRSDESLLSAEVHMTFYYKNEA